MDIDWDYVFAIFESGEYTVGELSEKFGISSSYLSDKMSKIIRVRYIEKNYENPVIKTESAMVIEGNPIWVDELINNGVLSFSEKIDELTNRIDND